MLDVEKGRGGHQIQTMTAGEGGLKTLKFCQTSFVNGPYVIRRKSNRIN